MANAPRDDNRVTAILGTLNTDGKTPVPIQVNSTKNALKVSDGSTGSDNGRLPAVRDGNRIPVILGVSSADGVSLVEIYSDSSGNLLIKST